MLLGQTNELLEQASIQFSSERVTVKEGENIHRVLAGPFLEKKVFWPTLVTEEGKKVVRMRSVSIPKTGSPLLSTLAAIDKEVRLTLGENDPKSQFKPSSSYLYLIFNREDTEPIVKIASYKFTIFKRLEEIQAELSSNDKNMLKNGLIFMYDVVLKKIIEDPKRPRYTTKYSADPDSENNKLMGSIPKELLNYSAAEIEKVLTENEIYPIIFTPEELKAIKDCDIDLEAQTKPMSEEEIRAKLIEFPICLNAKDSMGRYYFPQEDKFMKALESAEISYLKEVDNQQVKEIKKLDDGDETQTIKEKPAEIQLNKSEVNEVKSENGTVLKRWKS